MPSVSANARQLLEDCRALISRIKKSSQDPRVRWTLLLPLSSLFFWAVFTGELASTAYVHARYAENALSGYGFVHQVGERIQGFSSPLTLMYLSTVGWLTSAPTLSVPVISFRIVGGVALLFTLLVAITRMVPSVKWSAFFLLFISIQATVISSAINGAESSIVSFLFLTAIIVGCDPKKAIASPTILGLAWGGLLWTRPDGCVYVLISAVVSAFSLYSNSKHGSNEWEKFRKSIAAATVICATIYIPWFVFSWSYFGSPVPQTLIAKSLTPLNYVSRLENLPMILLDRTASIFSPSYFSLGGWPNWVSTLSIVLSVGSGLVWMLPVFSIFARAVSLSFFLLIIYFTVAVNTLEPWYLSTATICASIALFELIRKIAKSQASIVSAGVVLVATSGFMFVESLRSAQLYQSEIVDGIGEKAAGFIEKRLQPEETLFVENLSVTAHMQGVRIKDYPGVLSPEVSSLRQRGFNQSEVIPVLRPDWILFEPSVLRGFEEALPSFRVYLHKYYALEKIFDARPRIALYSPMSGKGRTSRDSVFWLLRRK